MMYLVNWSLSEVVWSMAERVLIKVPVGADVKLVDLWSFRSSPFGGRLDLLSWRF